MAKLTIRQASIKFDYSEMYLRKLLIEGKLEGEKVDGAWLIDESALQKKSAQTSSVRDNRSYIVHIDDRDYDEIAKYLESKHISIERRFVYDDKRKEYNAKRAAMLKEARK